VLFSCVLFVSGGALGAVLRDDVLQHVMFVQQAGLHACALALFERMHVRAEIGKGADTIVNATRNAMVILPDMTR
jgi:hypothetical protein